MNKIFTLCASLIVLMCPFHALAQPSNDDACNAISIIVDDPAISGDNTEATAQDDEVIPPGLGTAVSMWYTFTAPSNGAVLISTCLNATDFDTHVALWEVGDCADFSTYEFLGLNDDSDMPCDVDLASILSIDGLISGATYYIQLDGYNGATGAFEIEVTTGTPVAWINFVHNSADLAIEEVDIRINGELVADDLAFRTNTGYMEVPAGPGMVITINDSESTDDSNPFYSITQDLDPVLNYVAITYGIYSESGYAPAPPLTLAIFSPALLGPSGPDDHDVLVFHGTTDAITVDVQVQELDDLTIIDNLVPGSFANEGYVNLAQQNYSLTITNDDGFPIGLEVCAPFAMLDGNYALTFVTSGFAIPEANSNGPAMGIFLVNHFDGTFMELEQGPCPVPDNDAACNATPLVVNDPPVLTTNLFATTDEGEITPPNLFYDDPEADCITQWCDGTLNGTVWFSFVAPASGNAMISTCQKIAIDTQVGLYTATDCADYSTFTYIAANDDTDGGCEGGDTYASTLVVDGLTPGTTYYIQVDGWEGTTGEFQISVTTTVGVGGVLADAIRVYPNPANAMLQVAGIQQKVDASLVDFAGRIVWKSTLSSNATIDISTLAAGVYTLCMEQNGVREMRKIIVE